MMDAVRLAIIGGMLWAAGAAALVFGVLPPGDALAIGERVWPILLFVVAMTVVAELAAAAGLFGVCAAWLARVSRGHGWLLWGLVFALAAVTTAFLSLDTTAVLLTPVVIAVARANGLPPLPFALTTVWVANTGSLLLPVSNLTNLLARERLGGIDPWQFAALLGPSAAAALVVPAVILALVFRRSIGTRYTPAAPPRVQDRPLLIASALVVGALLPLLLAGIEPWIPTLGAAAVLSACFAVRARRSLRPSLVPWQLVVFAGGLFLVVGAVEAWGAAAFTTAVAGGGDDLADLWRLAGAGAASANLLNNLPAYLALEATADTPVRMAALLIGVNAGPLITPWASLATLLWHQRLVADGVHIAWSRFALLGAVAAPLTIAAAVVPLTWR
ncbi:SLC13 family permease [Microbacterium sp. NPDC078428]|uniref:SLC13 family permease n=1 Tax=Microbacterium sp. NPDC078428 TaxID=3364190 RepID=UPI0037C686C0